MIDSTEKVLIKQLIWVLLKNDRHFNKAMKKIVNNEKLYTDPSTTNTQLEDMFETYNSKINALNHLFETATKEYKKSEKMRRHLVKESNELFSLSREIIFNYLREKDTGNIREIKIARSTIQENFKKIRFQRKMKTIGDLKWILYNIDPNHFDSLITDDLETYLEVLQESIGIDKYNKFIRENFSREVAEHLTTQEVIS
jgi:hypothetical protein